MGSSVPFVSLLIGRPRPVLFGLALFASLIPLSGCVAVHTKTYQDSVTEKPKDDAKGFLYYLPAARISLHLMQDPDSKKTTISVTKIDPYPDPETALRLVYNLPLTADEHFCVTRSKYGLLEQVELDSVDRTGDIIVKVAETARAVTLMGAGLPAPGIRTSQTTDGRKTPLDVTFNPCQPTEAATAARKIGDWWGPGWNANFDLGKMCNAQETTARCPLGSVCYRTFTKALFDLNLTHTKDGHMTYEIVADFPDLKRVGVIDIERVMFTRTVTKLGFTEGMLTSFTASRPSPLYEASRIPLRVINAVLDVPVDFFNKIVKSFQSEASANFAAAELLKAQAELIRAQKNPSEANEKGKDTTHGSDIGSAPSPPPAFISERVCAGTLGTSTSTVQGAAEKIAEKKATTPPKPGTANQ